MHSLSFDIGGTFTKVMVFEEGKEKDFYQIPTRARQGIDFLRADIFAEIRKNIGLYQISRVGLATAGIVAADGTILEVGSAFKDYRDFNWAREINDEFQIPALVENDARAAAFGEYYFGSAKDYSSAYMVTIGTGIGGCLIENGKIYRGSYGKAGEIGYIPKEDSNIGALASSSGLLRRARKLYPEQKWQSAKEIHQLALRGDRDAQRLVAYQIDALAELLASLALILDPQVILIGGAIADQKENLIDPIKQVMAREIPKSIMENIKIKPASLGNKAACYGVNHLACLK